MPEDTRQPLMSNGVWLDDRAPEQASAPISQPVPTIVEARGWVRNPDGSISLIATHPGGTTQAFSPLSCAVPSK